VSPTPTGDAFHAEAVRRGTEWLKEWVVDDAVQVVEYEEEVEGVLIASGYPQALRESEQRVSILERQRDSYAVKLADKAQALSEAVTELQGIAQYDPRWTGMHVNDAPSRAQLIERAYDALSRIAQLGGEKLRNPRGLRPAPSLVNTNIWPSARRVVTFQADES
jgi:DNA repair ATPase RecN